MTTTRHSLVTRHSSLVTSLALAIAAVAVMTSAGEPRLGVCAHVSRDEFDGRERTFDMMREAGLDCIRTDFDWRICQKEPGGPFDFSRYDRVVNDAGARGISTLPILGSPPRWARPVTEHLDEWRAFVRAAATHFKGRIPVYEIWNEENHPGFWPNPNPADYVSALRAAFEEIKAADPSALVCMGGTAGADSKFIDGVYAANGRDVFDILAIHPYCAPQPPEFFLDEALGRIRGVMSRYGDAKKPLWITEMGWPTHTAALPEQNLLLAGLRVAQPQRRIWRVGCVGVSDDTAAAAAVAAGLRKILPEGSTAQAYTPTGLVAALEADALDLVVFPVAEAFPLETLEAVRDFVAKGGTLVDFGGAPMWFAYRGGRTADRLPDGRTTHDVAWEQLRISVVFPTKENGLTAPTTVRATPEGLAAGLHNDLNGFPCHRFFDAARLKEGDVMVPLLTAPRLTGGSRARATEEAPGIAGEPPTPPEAVGACVYRFGSDYKGSIVLSGNMSVEKGGNSEGEQADYLLRALPVAARHGVECFIVYEFRATEKVADNREDHFGIVHADFSPKAAYRALADRAAKQTKTVDGNR